MSTSSLFTAFFDSLSDPKSYFKLDFEFRTRLVENHVFNLFRGKKSFQAIVLQVNKNNPPNTIAKTSSGGHVIIKVRPLDIHDFLIGLLRYSMNLFS